MEKSQDKPRSSTKQKGFPSSYSSAVFSRSFTMHTKPTDAYLPHHPSTLDRACSTRRRNTFYTPFSSFRVGRGHPLIRSEALVAAMASVVAASHPFSPAEDAEALWGACQGWGTDEKAIISILGHRNAAQRKEIRQAYEQLHQEDLLKRLESELSGDFEKAVYRWILDPADRDAILVNVALKKSTQDYHVIIEISCILSAEELLEVRTAYKIRYKRSMEEDVASHTIGDVRKLLVALVSSYRYEGDEVDARLAKSEADILDDAIKDKALNHEEVIRILTTRSKLQLRATFNRFRDDKATSITKGMLDEKHDEFASAVRTVIRCINDHKKYYEKVLRNAIKKLGTDGDSITRVIVSRAEKDMKEIKDVYFKRNIVTLDQALAKETSGDYKVFMLTLLGNQD